MPRTDLTIELPTTRAIAERWRKGRLVHGTKFVGDPLNEWYEELIDAINYVDEVATRDPAADVDWCRDQLLRMAEHVRALWQKRQEKEASVAQHTAL